DGTTSLPAKVVHAARDSIGTSIQVASKLPAPLAGRLHSVARHAFLTSMRVSYAVGFLFICGATFIAFKFLPARAATFPGAEDDDEALMRAAALEIGVEDAV